MLTLFMRTPHVLYTDDIIDAKQEQIKLAKVAHHIGRR